MSERRSVEDILGGNGLPTGEHHNGHGNTYFAHKIAKLQKVSGFESISNIFMGCYVFVNGFTDPPRNEVRRLVCIHGGNFDSYQTSRTTHFVCNYFPNTKIVNLRKPHTTKIVYITMEWLLESINQMRRLPESNFLPPGLKGFSGGNMTQYYIHQKPPMLSEVEGKHCNTSSSDLIPANIEKHALICSINEGFSDLDYRNGGMVSPPATSLAISNDKESIPIFEIANLVRDTEASTSISSSADSCSESHSRFRSNITSGENFISQFFDNSRLHFIGSWKAKLPRLMASFGNKKDNSKMDESDRKTCAASPPTTTGTPVVHLDMDCFFASVLIRNRPELQLVPVAVAHCKKGGTSEVSSCNYPARSHGVKNGMMMAKALALCPALKVLQYDFLQYEQVSEQIYRIFWESSPLIEPVSVDEAYLLVPSTFSHAPLDFVTQLRKRIFDETGCLCSAGVGPNKLIARLATRKAKPCGQYMVTQDTVRDFMSSMSLSDINGVGHQLSHDLQEKGYVMCMDLWSVPKCLLQSWFGPGTGSFLFDASRGVDHSCLEPVAERKSIGADVNWGVRFSSLNEAERFTCNLCLEVSKRMNEADCSGKTVTLRMKVRQEHAPKVTKKFLGHGVCDNVSKSHTSANSIQSHDALFAICKPLLAELLRGVPPEDVRGVGVQVSKLRYRSDRSTTDSFAEEESAKQTSLQRHFSRPADKPAIDVDRPSCDTVSYTAAASSESSKVTRVSEPPKRSNSGDTTPGSWVIPTHIDESVLAVMPSPLRAEIEQEISRRRQQGYGVEEKAYASHNASTRDKGARNLSSVFLPRTTIASSDDLHGEISSTTMLINSDVNDTGSSTLSPDHSTLDEISASQADFLSCMPMELFDEIKSEILTSNNRQGDTAAAIKPNANHARLSKIELPIRSKRNVSTISDASDKRGASVKLNATKGYSKQRKIDDSLKVLEWKCGTRDSPDACGAALGLSQAMDREVMKQLPAGALFDLAESVRQSVQRPKPPPSRHRAASRPTQAPASKHSDYTSLLRHKDVGAQGDECGDDTNIVDTNNKPIPFIPSFACSNPVLLGNECEMETLDIASVTYLHVDIRVIRETLDMWQQVALKCGQECIYETQSSILCNYGLWLVENKRLDLACSIARLIHSKQRRNPCWWRNCYQKFERVVNVACLRIYNCNVSFEA